MRIRPIALCFLPEGTHASHIESPYYLSSHRSTLVLVCLGPSPSNLAIPSTGFPGLDQYRASRIAVFTDDYGQLARYRAANAALKPPAPGENRVVFFGDSITDIWKLEEYFPGKPYVNRGIGGQTTPQMLVRFRQDVIDLHPKVVVILAGTNDIAGNTGPMRLEDIEANYASMAELARAQHIAVVYSSVMPVHNYTPLSQNIYAFRSPAKILELNVGSKTMSPDQHFYLDYFSAMVDDKGLLKRDLADDGLHPTPRATRSWPRWPRPPSTRRWREALICLFVRLVHL